MNQYSTKHFTYDKVRKEFVTDASDINFPSVSIRTRSLHIVLVSHVTNEKAMFLLSRIVCDEEGEVTAHYYKPLNQEVINRPRLQGVKVIIFND